MSIKDNAYQKNVSQKKIDSLTSFLEDIQCLRGVRTPKKPSFFKEGKEVKTLDRLLLEAEADKEIAADDVDIDIDNDEGSGEADVKADPEQKVAAKADEKEAAAETGALYLGPNQRYFMGAGTDPLLTIVTGVDDKKIKYFQYPWKKEQIINKEIGQSLLQKGSKTWLDKNQETSEEDLKKSIEAVLAGKPGEKVALDDYQFANIQVRYTGPEKGDDKPWEELEQKFNVNVGGVLANKQTYNIRLTNRALGKLEDELRNVEPADRHFKIVKIMKEEEDYAYFTECMGIYPMNPYAAKPKIEKRDVPADQFEWYKKMVELGLRNNVAFGDFKIGECVVFEDENWTIAEFIPWMKEPAAMLVNQDITKMADQVPLKKIRKMTPEELSGQKAREEIVKGLNQKTLDFPTSGPDGETKDIVKEVKGKKGKKAKGSLNESLFEDRVEELADFINNDAETYKKDFAPIAKNLTSKWNEGNYDKNLALKSFKQLAESAGKRFFVANDGECEGRTYGDPKEMFPEEIVEKVALVLRKSFENQANAGEIKEAIEMIAEGKKPTDQEASSNVDGGGNGPIPFAATGSDQSDIDAPSIGAPFREADEEESDTTGKELKKVMKGQNTDAKENIPFTEKEKAALKEASTKVQMDILNNAAVITWDGGEGTVKLTISKIPQPQQKTSVYSAESEIDGELDKDRTINSDSFDTEDDVAILKNFLTQLRLNEEEEMSEEKQQIWGEPVKKVHYVNSLPIRNDKKIKSEVIGNIRHVYKLTKDIPSQKAGYIKGKKKSAKKKKHHKTKVKLVSHYPIVDGEPVHSQTIGNITYRYQTKQDKKIAAEKRKKTRKLKRYTMKEGSEFSPEFTLVSADKSKAVIKTGDGKEISITRYQPFETKSGEWVFTEYSPADGEDAENIMLIQKAPEGKSTKIITVYKDKNHNL